MAAGWKKFTGSSQYPELRSNKEGSAFTYGSKQDRKFRMGWIQGKRDLVEESRILNWVSKVSGRQLSGEYDQVLEELHDGKILCSFLIGLNAQSLNRPINNRAAMFSATENITNFLDSILNFGISESDLFAPNDILEKKDLTGLVNTLTKLKIKLESQH